jgi:hypothetical protein
VVELDLFKNYHVEAEETGLKIGAKRGKLGVQISKGRKPGFRPSNSASRIPA